MVPSTISLHFDLIPDFRIIELYTGTSRQLTIGRKKPLAHKWHTRDLYEVHRFSSAIVRIDVCATARDWREGPASQL